ncbi:DUF4352 domain-containing protein [Listeria sp. ILCC797]|uniref:DUF4352 domain-containing protein n=1 Tax=Listeria sp. ILCC797 TaxID=1918333 RepID=UPI000B596529|nr:DUF4352 domain-containing protein [Listeria sp. ILCC797]
MKKGLRGTLVLLAIATVIISAACSNDSTKEKKTSENKNYVSKTVNNMNMKINSIDTTENAKGNQNMVEINMLITNKDSGEVSIGAGDFEIRTDDKTYTVYPKGNNFGDVIAQGKKLTGSAFFELPKSVKKAELVYVQNKKEAANWDIEIPSAK